MRVNIGMPEILVIGSIVLFQSSIPFATTLLVLGVFGRVTGYAMDIQKKKEEHEAGKEAVKKIADTFSNAVTLGSIVNGKKDKFH